MKKIIFLLICVANIYAMETPDQKKQQILNEIENQKKMIQQNIESNVRGTDPQETDLKRVPNLEFIDRKSIDKPGELKESAIEFKKGAKQLEKEQNSRSCKACCLTCGLAICCKKYCK